MAIACFVIIVMLIIYKITSKNPTKITTEQIRLARQLRLSMSLPGDPIKNNYNELA